MRYGVIGGVGAVLFAIASVISERAGKDVMGVVKIAVAALAFWAVVFYLATRVIWHFP